MTQSPVEDSCDGARKPSVWVVTDGKIGDEVQCLAIAGALNPDFEKRVAAPRAPWVWAAPWGPVDPREAPGREGGPLAGMPPDIAIMSGRRVIPHARVLKKASDGRTRIIMLKDPRIARDAADALWIPSHDQVRGDNVIATLTSPHGLASKLKSDAAPCAAIAGLPKPFLGVVLGGPAGGAQYNLAASRDLAARITQAAKSYAAIAVTPSRRTPPQFLEAMRSAIVHDRLFVWDGSGENPYADMLAHAGALIVAADSHNMVSEALASRAGVYLWRPDGLAKKMNWFADQLVSRGDAREFENTANAFARTPIDATQEIVAAIEKLLSR